MFSYWTTTSPAGSIYNQMVATKDNPWEPEGTVGGKFHHTAYVDPESWVGKGSVVGAHAKIQLGAIVEEYTQIGTYSWIGTGCVIGSRVTIGTQVIVQSATEIGDGAVLRDLVYVGARSLIGENAFLADRVKIGYSGTVDARGVYTYTEPVPPFATVQRCGIVLER